MAITAYSTPNIAFIKYWGNRVNEFRLPAADSLSMTLDSPSVEISVEDADELMVTSLLLKGGERKLTEKEIDRFREQLQLTKNYLTMLDAQDVIPREVAITIRSHIPPRIGLASSAAVFSALARAYAGLIHQHGLHLTDEQTSVIARFGSGSAARSIYGGFVALDAGTGDAIDAAKARQIADEHHWELNDIVVVPDMQEKKVGSTEGHELAHTSPFFQARLEAIRSKQQKECIDAILTKDFEKLQAVTEEDTLDMHHVMETSNPPLRYVTEETHRIRREIENLRTSEHLEVLYTMDAGPTVHLICTEAARPSIVAFANAQKGCTVFETKIGRGAHLA
jgi:diphosphomevalonate decarboxylase